MPRKGKVKPKDKIRGGWDQEVMNEAMAAIFNGLPVRAASRLYGIPETTLRYRLDKKKKKMLKALYFIY